MMFHPEDFDSRINKPQKCVCGHSRSTHNSRFSGNRKINEKKACLYRACSCEKFEVDNNLSEDKVIDKQGTITKVHAGKATFSSIIAELDLYDNRSYQDGFIEGVQKAQKLVEDCLERIKFGYGSSEGTFDMESKAILDIVKRIEKELGLNNQEMKGGIK